jgi:hypothetical protein
MYVASLLGEGDAPSQFRAIPEEKGPVIVPWHLVHRHPPLCHPEDEGHGPVPRVRPPGLGRHAKAGPVSEEGALS